MKSETVPIDTLTLDPRNTRVHDERNLSTIAASLKRFGQVKPIVVDADGLIVAGNGTVEAARSLGWTEVAAVRTKLKGAEASAYAIADNRTAELATWDEPALSIMLKELREDIEIDETVTGFSITEIDEYLMPTDVVEDEVPEPPDDPITQPGDLWIMCEHRVLCGDSTKADDVGRVMDGGRAALCLTDPPYGVGLEYASWEDSLDNLTKLIVGFLPLARSVSDVVLLTPGNGRQYDYPHPTWTLCWRVPAAITRASWGFCSWQPIIAYGKDPYLSQGLGARPDSFDCNEAAPKDLDHPCPKPMAIWAWLVERGSTSQGDLIYDPFLGSGTTLIAAEQLGRKCYGLEIEPRYVDVIVKRWEKLTGQKATLAK